MMGFLLRAVISAIGLWLATQWVTGVHYDSVGALIGAGVVLGVVNAIIRPIAFILTLPVTILTLGLTLRAIAPVDAAVAGKERDARRHVDHRVAIRAAGFDEEHPQRIKHRQAVGEHTAGGAGAHDDVVVGRLLTHGAASCAIRSGLPPVAPATGRTVSAARSARSRVGR